MAINAFSGIGVANILANPRILAINNVEAKIDIGTGIPVATGFNQQTTAGTTAGTFVTSGTIQYRSIGQ